MRFSLMRFPLLLCLIQVYPDTKKPEQWEGVLPEGKLDLSEDKVHEDELHKIIQIAFNRSKELTNAKNQVSSARKALSLRKFAIIQPEIKLQGSCAQHIGLQYGTLEPYIETWADTQDDFYHRQISLILEMPVSFQELSQYAKAKYELILAEMTLHDIKIKLQARIIYLITTIQLQEKSINISKNILSAYDKVVTLLKNRADKGDITSRDMHQVTLTRALRGQIQAKIAYESANAELESGVRELNEILGHNYPISEILKINILIHNPDSQLSVSDIMHRDRKLIEMYVRMRDSSHDVQRIKNATYLPDIRPAVALTNTYSKFGPLRSREPYRIRLSCNMEMKLYSANANAEVYQAMVKANAAEEQYYDYNRQSQQKAIRFLCKKNNYTMYDEMINASISETYRMERALKLDPLDQDALYHYAEVAEQYASAVSQKLQDLKENGEMYCITSISLPDVINGIKLPQPYYSTKV